MQAHDDQLLAMGVAANPELGALAAKVRGRSDALALAKLSYLPDISPTFSLTGDVSRSIGAMVVLPTTIPMIEAQIRESRDMLKSGEAMLRQVRSDRAATLVATLYALRNDEKQKELFLTLIMPSAQQILRSSREAYASGREPYADLIDAQRTLLNVRLQVANLHIEREKRLAELEELMGVDVETLANTAATRPTTQDGGEVEKK